MSVTSGAVLAWTPRAGTRLHKAPELREASKDGESSPNAMRAKPHIACMLARRNSAVIYSDVEILELVELNVKNNLQGAAHLYVVVQDQIVAAARQLIYG